MHWAQKLLTANLYRHSEEQTHGAEPSQRRSRLPSLWYEMTILKRSCLPLNVLNCVFCDFAFGYWYCSARYSLWSPCAAFSRQSHKRHMGDPLVSCCEGIPTYPRHRCRKFTEDDPLHGTPQHLSSSCGTYMNYVNSPISWSDLYPDSQQNSWHIVITICSWYEWKFT